MYKDFRFIVIVCIDYYVKNSSFFFSAFRIKYRKFKFLHYIEITNNTNTIYILKSFGNDKIYDLNEILSAN